MELVVAGRVEKGKRESNDDRALLRGVLLDESAHDGTTTLPALVVVCDGCGGYAGGGIAAQTVLAELAKTPVDTMMNPAFIPAVLERCRVAVENRKRELPRFDAMCTTVSGCVFLKDKTVIFHTGDSRVYRFDGTWFTKMTTDHSRVQEMVDMGMITEEEARNRSDRNVITRCIGIACEAPHIYVEETPIGAGDVYLICSDGLWEYVDSDTLKRILSEEGPLREKADRMVEAALKNGGDDNVSVCLCMTDEAAPKREKAADKPFRLD